MDIIFVSMENWDEIWRRNQFLCAEFARRFPNDKILFVGLSRDVSNQIRRGKFKGLFVDDTRVSPDFAQITLTRPLKLFPNTLRIGRLLNDSMARNYIRKQVSQLGMKSPVLWLNPHSAHHLAGAMNESMVIYDITDDWTTLTQSDATRRLTIEQDALLCKKADAVIVCSQRLYDLKKSLAQNLHLIANGVDADHYASVLETATSPIPETADWIHPVLGYTGTIHPDRVDIPLVYEMAKSMKQGSIALVGPCHLKEPEAEKLRATGRVFITGSVPYSTLPRIMQDFDVCITPHHVTEFTESLNPIKLWEYLAAGKPIVSTAVAGFRDYPQHVRVAKGAEAFLQAAFEGLTEASESKVLRRKEAEKHSWTSRADAVLEVMSGVSTGRSRR